MSTLVSERVESSKRKQRQEEIDFEEEESEGSATTSSSSPKSQKLSSEGEDLSLRLASSETEEHHMLRRIVMSTDLAKGFDAFQRSLLMVGVTFSVLGNAWTTVCKQLTAKVKRGLPVAIFAVDYLSERSQKMDVYPGGIERLAGLFGALEEVGDHQNLSFYLVDFVFYSTYFCFDEGPVYRIVHTHRKSTSSGTILEILRGDPEYEDVLEEVGFFKISCHSRRLTRQSLARERERCLKELALLNLNRNAKLHTETPKEEQKGPEDRLKSLKGNEDLDSLKAIWTILKPLLESLLSSEPTDGVTPKVWVLNKNAPTFERDRRFISEHLPGHRVFPIRNKIIERGGGVEVSEGGQVVSLAFSTPPNPPERPPPTRIHVGARIVGNTYAGTLGLLIPDGSKTYGLTAAHLSLRKELSKDEELSVKNHISLFTPLRTFEPLGHIPADNYFYENCSCGQGCSCPLSCDFMLFKMRRNYSCQDPPSHFGERIHLWHLQHPTDHWRFSLRGASTGETALTIPSSSMAVLDFLNTKQMLVINEIITSFGASGDSGAGLFFYDSQGRSTFLGIYKGDDHENHEEERTLVFTPADRISQLIRHSNGYHEGSSL